MVFRQQQRQHVRESNGVPMRTVRKNFSMMLRYLMWEAPIKTGAVRQDGHIVDTKIPSAILPCFSLRTECRGNELLMLHPPPCSAALVRIGHKLPPGIVPIGPIPESQEVGCEELGSRKHGAVSSLLGWETVPGLF